MVGSAGAALGGGRRWQVFAVAGIVATACYSLSLSPAVSYPALFLVGAGTVWALVSGPRRCRAEPRVAWQLLTAAALCFLLGVVIRPWATAQPFPLVLLADALTIPGYALTGVFLLILLRARRSVDWLAVLDGLIVCVAGGLVCALLLAAPTAAVEDRASFVPVLAAVYPFFDVVLLLLVVNLTFTTTTWPVSLVAFLGAMALLFTGDLAYAIIAVSGRAYASPLLDVPFLLGFTLLGVSALHPSATTLSRAARRPVQAWSARRMALLGPAVATPFVLLVTVGGRSAADRVTIGVAGAVMVLLLLLRAKSAVQAQVAAQLRSEHQARHDPLTGLPNRGMLSAEIERMLGRLPAGGEQRVWVFLLDLDGFKWVNESWGHDTGDQLVIEVAARLRAAVPAADMVARVGGDEFLIAHTGDKAGALRLVEEIRGCFARPVALHDTELVIGASIGIAHADGVGDPTVTAEALMRDADTAMYRSKAEGPGRSTVFDTSMHDRVRERIELESALRTALTDGQLRVAYQPIVHLDTGRPLGAEALVRWTHPVRGAIAPMAFIPIAEEAGMIGRIGTWVREEAFAQLARWRADGTARRK